MSTITAVNSRFTIIVPLVFPAPVSIQGYATDDAFAAEPVESAQVKMGVDGIMSHGLVPFITKLRVMLQADSPSVSLFETWLAANQAIQDSIAGQAEIALPSIGKTFIFIKCVLTRITPMPAAKAVLEPVEYELSIERVQSLPLVA